MADSKISELAYRSDLTGTEQALLAYLGHNYRTTVSEIASFIQVAPSLLPNRPALYCMASAISPVPDGTPIYTWVDQSPSGNNLYRNPGSPTPKYYNNVFGTQPALRFVGGTSMYDSDWLMFSSQITLDHNFTVIVIGSLTSNSVVFGYSSANRQIKAGTEGSNILSIYEGTATITSAILDNSLNSLRMMVWRRYGRQYIDFFENGRYKIPTAGGTTMLQIELNRMGITSPFFNPLKGDIAEVMIWTIDLPDDEIYNLYHKYVRVKFPTITF